MNGNGKGFFLTLEGGEGAGKTTQARLLRDYLTDRGREVVLTREPGGVPEAEKIRDLIVQRDSCRWSPLAECLLLFAARLTHYETLILPALAEGKVVICDRFTDSTRVYQGAGRGFDRAIIEQIKTLTLGDFEPDMTFVFDLPVEEGLKRSLAQKEKASALSPSSREKTEDKFESLDLAFHERIRRGFLDLSREFPGRCVVLDAALPIEEVLDSILRNLPHDAV